MRLLPRGKKCTPKLQNLVSIHSSLQAISSAGLWKSLYKELVFRQGFCLTNQGQTACREAGNRFEVALVASSRSGYRLPAIVPSQEHKKEGRKEGIVRTRPSICYAYKHDYLIRNLETEQPSCPTPTTPSTWP